MEETGRYSFTAFSYYTIWQYADSGSNPGDQDVFNGSQTQLVK